MPSANRKKVNIQYRKLEDLSSSFKKHTLQSALAESLKASGVAGLLADSVESRQYDADKTYGTIVLNYVEPKESFFFGEIVRFEPGADLPLVQIGSKLKAYNLTQAKAPAGHEPIRGVLYFMAIGNHLMVLESDVSTGRAETYLSWLFSEATQVLEKGTHVILLAELNHLAGAMQLSKVEEVVFKPKSGASLGDKPSVGSEIDTVSSTTRGVSETNTWDVLKAAGMADTDIQNLVSSETTIEIVLQIKFKGKNRRRPIGIDDANRLLRNIPEDQITLSGPGGRQKNGKIVKLSYPANIELVGSLLKTTDVARALNEGYKYFVSNGYITE